jgi:hypothetical protein
MKRPQDLPSTGRGSVRGDEVLTLREFGRRLGLGKSALCDAQRQGLRAVLFGRVKFIVGSDALDWFRRLAADHDNGDLDHDGNRTHVV